ncbi:MAG: sigma-70 family RNA polymerase sigma factor [Planctomycetes bacterium]|nr:sigma-70 family RNA polymerase sigma factor [Planctomycetota bacterium]
MSDFSIANLQALDESEWARLEEEYSPRIFFYVKKQVQDHQTAEDLTQEAFLGAVRGIANFDEQYTLEQYLFGIARNRVVDHFRKKRPIPISQNDDPSSSRSYIGLERMASDRRTPDESAVAFESVQNKSAALAAILKEYVAELWMAGEFEKLKILEFLFALGGRNKEAAERFDVRDEKSIAGIKFRAIERLRALARQRDPQHDLFEGLWSPGAR